MTQAEALVCIFCGKEHEEGTMCPEDNNDKNIIRMPTKGRELAAEICKEAANAIGPGKDREQSHGKMDHSFGVAAELWTAYLGTKINPGDVAACMALLKFSRIKTGDSRRKDHYVDICGYAGLQGALNDAE